jgi:hypothetical protein
MLSIHVFSVGFPTCFLKTIDLEKQPWHSGSTGAIIIIIIIFFFFALYVSSHLGRMVYNQTRLKILPVLTREHYTRLLHWV